MYRREIKETPNKIIQKGKPIFGSFIEHPQNLDIRNVKFPFGVLPLPNFITNIRIRSHISFEFSTEEYIGIVDILDAKICAFSDLVIWSKKTGHKFAYRNLILFHRHLIPYNLDKAICSTTVKRRYVRIAWDRKRERFSMIFTMKGDNVRPTFSGVFIASFDSPEFAELTSVLPAPTRRRCFASYQSCFQISGSLSPTKNKEDSVLLPQQGLSFFCLKRGYYNLRETAEFLYGTGYYKDKPLCFRLSVSSILPHDADTYNENVMFYDGKTTTLPPIVITFPNGILQQWIIQDTESMIDLSFTPLSDSLRKISIFILHTQYHTMYGNFNGVLLTQEGESLHLKDFIGIAQKTRIRL